MNNAMMSCLKTLGSLTCFLVIQRNVFSECLNSLIKTVCEVPYGICVLLHDKTISFYRFSMWAQYCTISRLLIINIPHKGHIVLSLLNTGLLQNFVLFFRSFPYVIPCVNLASIFLSCFVTLPMFSMVVLEMVNSLLSAFF